MDRAPSTNPVVTARSRVLAGAAAAALPIARLQPWWLGVAVAYSLFALRANYTVPYKEDYRGAIRYVDARATPDDCYAFAPFGVAPLPGVMIEPSVRAALLEDLGRAGDVTTDAIVPPDARTVCAMVARQPGVVAGLDFALTAFRLTDPAIEARVFLQIGRAHV